MVRKPPDILITTPESLYLLLTSQARETLRGIETVIVDEVHAVAGTKRGAHLALSLERLDRLAESPIQRIGLSATQRPLEEIGRFVSGGREIELVDAGRAKELDLKVVVPLDDMREPEEQQSIWPSIYPEILELVRAHRSTIVFVNNRRLAERLALRLNDLAEEEIARAHHGSLAREQRVEVEELLKKGEIPCLVATSSLELGIDMGAVDLVIQVESPKSVARGLQRVGRAGHELDAVSKGRIFPKFRADLLESAVVVKRHARGRRSRRRRSPATRSTCSPSRSWRSAPTRRSRSTSCTSWCAAPIRSPISRASSSRTCSTCSTGATRRTSSPSCGRASSGTAPPASSRAARARGGSRSRTRARSPIAGCSASTSWTAAAAWASSTRRWSTRRARGRRSCSARATWRIEEITRDRVLVSPAPGVPGAVPFWKGEGVGRPYELGEAIGATSRELVALSDEKATARLQSEHKLDERAATNLLTFLREQEAATGAVPSDRTVVVERFRDEIGDWRLCILTPFGGRVHAPWALALGARLRASLGLETQAIWSDDGIAIHLPDADAPPPVEEVLLEPEQIEELVTQELGETALFGARFRENAGRSLLIPRRRPGERTPLWQQRLKAQSLLQVARRYPAFPIVLETYRECLQDVFDLPALKRLLQGLRTRQIDLVDVETASASPYAASLLFDYVANYMYEDDTPAAERRAQALSLDRDLLRELLGQEELRDLIDPGALEEVEQQLRGAARSPDELHDLLRRRGDLREGEYPEDLAEPLLAERRAVHIRVAGEQRLIAAEDAGRYRDAVGAMSPGGLPEVFLEADDEPVHSLVRRFARSRGPFTTAEANARFGRDVEAVLRELERRDELVRGELRPGGSEREWCDPEVLRRLRRASLAALRREVEPAEQAALGRFLPAWHGIGRRASLREALVPLQGLALPVALWEGDVLPRRVPGYRPEQLDALCASGEVVWIGAGLDRVTVYFREDAPALGPPPAADRPEKEIHERLRAALGRSALFWHDLLLDTGLEAEEALPALWDLVWAGEVTNDAWTPLRAARRNKTQAQRPRPRRFSRRRSGEVTATQGRWSLTARLFPGRPDRRALAELLLERQGIVTRDGVRGEGVPGGYGAVYGELKALETLGLCRRGYFVEGLGGAQFALGGAVERLRELRPKDGEEAEQLVLAAADPAQPYGAAIPWPKRAGARAARVAGAHVVLLGGEPALYVERGGRSLVPLREPNEEWLRPAIAALVAHVKAGGAKRLAVERFDSEPVGETEIMPLLLEAGFLAGPRRAVLRP